MYNPKTRTNTEISVQHWRTTLSWRPIISVRRTAFTQADPESGPPKMSHYYRISTICKVAATRSCLYIPFYYYTYTVPGIWWSRLCRTQLYCSPSFQHSQTTADHIKDACTIELQEPIIIDIRFIKSSRSL